MGKCAFWRRATKRCKIFKFWIFWECPLYEIWEYAFKVQEKWGTMSLGSKNLCEMWFSQASLGSKNLCECDLVKPLWLEIGNIFLLNTEFDSQLSNFEKVFGIIDNKFLTYIILCTKYFIYRGKFQDKKPHINGLKSFIKSQREIELCIAKRRGKLSLHFKKWPFVL